MNILLASSKYLPNRGSRLTLRLILLLLFIQGQLLHSQTYRVLFLGNSYTNANNLPSIIESLAAASSDTLIWDWNTPGGYTYQLHSTDPTSLAKISAQKWDYVVLQEQSQLPSFPPSQVQSQVFPYADLLDSLIRENWSCTEPVFFMTWGRKYGDQANCPSYPPLCTFLGMNGRLRQSYEEMALLNSATMAPVGMAWQYSWLADSSINLWSPDYSHPSMEGSYLAACVFYGVLFQKSPIGNSYLGGLTSNTANFLQQIAHSTLFDSLEVWTGNGGIPTARFGHQTNHLNVMFTDSSINAHAWEWNFGDGASSIAASPSHTYPAAGQYLVTLDVYSDCRSHRAEKAITVTSDVSIPEEAVSLLRIYPNPGDGRVYLDVDVEGEASIELISVDGRLLYSGPFEKYYDFSGMPGGIYTLILKVDDAEPRYSRIVINK